MELRSACLGSMAHDETMFPIEYAESLFRWLKAGISFEYKKPNSIDKGGLIENRTTWHAAIRPIRIVVVDDDQDDFFLITQLLGDIDRSLYQTRWIPDFSTAIVEIKKQEADLYLIDFNLGAKTGLDILKELKVYELSRPMILLTGLGDRELDLSAMNEGASDFLKKSNLSAETLERAIRYAMRSAEDFKRIKAAEKNRIEKEMAEAASLAKSRFLAHMSHEIRTPLTAMLGFSELAKNSDLPAHERTEFLEIIHRSGHHLLRIINDILDLSKVEEGRMDIELSQFKIQDVLCDVLKLLEPTANTKGLRLILNIGDGLPEFVKSDAHFLRQILVNTIGNAIKFTRHGSITIDVHCVPMETQFAISIRDTGVGIKASEQEKLFQPFSQAKSDYNRQFGGTGLGLNLSRKLARTLGGDLLLTCSEPGVGSTFVLSLPIHSSSLASGKNPAIIARTVQHVLPFEKIRVLVAEDSKDNQLLVRLFLKDTEIEASFVNNGIEAVREALSGNFDAILMDIQMPEMDGYEATKQLRKSGYRKPIIALTAHAFREEEEKILRSGFTDFVSKPISRERLLSALRDSNKPFPLVERQFLSEVRFELYGHDEIAEHRC